MEITKIELVRFDEPPERGECAVYRIELDNQLCIPSVKVKNGQKGKFVAFPYVYKTDTLPPIYKDAVFPINSEFRDYITQELLTRYEEDYTKYEKGEIIAEPIPEHIKANWKSKFYGSEK